MATEDTNAPLLDIPACERTLSLGSVDGWGSVAFEDFEITENSLEKEVEKETLPLKFIKRFQNYSVKIVGDQVKLKLALKVSDLGIKKEVVYAWGLKRSSYVIAELWFTKSFLQSPFPPSVSVGQCSKLDGVPEPFLLSRTLSLAITDIFFDKGGLLPLPDPDFSPGEIENVMEIAGTDFYTALASLKMTKSRQPHDAVHLLCKSSFRKKVDKLKASFLNRFACGKKGFEANSESKRNIQDATAWNVEEIAMQYQLPITVVELAFDLESDREAALALITSESSRKQLIDCCIDDYEEGFDLNQPEELLRDPERAKSSTSNIYCTGSNSPDSPGKTQDELGRVEEFFDSFPTPRLIRASSEDQYEPNHSWKDGGEILAGQDEIDDCAVASYWVDFSYVVRLFLFFEHRILHANMFCISCAQSLEFEGLKPVVCTRKLCMMTIQELGIGFDLAYEIRSQPEVVDYLISTTYSACLKRTLHFGSPVNIRVEVDDVVHTFRKEDPEAEAKTNTSKVVKGAEDEKYTDYERLTKCLNAIPPLSKLVTLAFKGSESLQKSLDEIDPLIFPFLRWLLTSIRAHIRPLSPTEWVQNTPAIAQFVLMSSSPEREARFRRLKRAAEIYQGKGKGSFYAWHGSPLSRWHSIIRTGLKNLSNTALMTTGAAQGAGIYMSPNIRVSLGYCRAESESWSGGNFQTTVCLSLCEVINHKDLKPPTPHYVITQEEWITTRYLFIFPSNGLNRIYFGGCENILRWMPKLDE